MEKLGALAPKLLGLVVLGALLEALGATRFLWAFPLVYPGLGAWLLFACGDAFLARSPWSGVERMRLLLWGSGLLYFSASSGFPLAGVFLLSAPAALWVLSRGPHVRLLRVALPGLVIFFLLGHDRNFYHWNVVSESALGWRYGFHLIAIFAFFRACSWLAAVAGRGERPGFFPTMEYFLAPVFWLSPLHASHLVWERMSSNASQKAQLDDAAKAQLDDAGQKALLASEASAWLWIARGLFHALLLSLISIYLFPWLGGVFGGGIHHVRWFEWLGLGPALFLIAYLDKSQVSYLVAGFFTLSGRHIEPDFRAPWLAKDLLDYWRRFHYWLWEFYMNVIYPLIIVPLSRRMRPERALPLALVLSFTIGTGVGHYLSYRASFLMSLSLGGIFGLATLAHYFLRSVFKDARIGIPATWLTVFLLYILAYPIFGLGWGLAEFRQFFGS